MKPMRIGTFIFLWLLVVKIFPAVAFETFPVLEYHLIGRPEGRWQRTPENFRKDLEWLYQNGYYPFNLRDVLKGFKGLP
ncbi:MAG: hypothetical protein ACPL4K_01935, partial [Candidatus Margulisiibacteriota bacterium]